MFRTELTIAPQERQLARTARVLTVGSCFADSIGARLRLNKVNALVNPFGTVFQPLALAQLLRAAAGEEQDWQQHVVEARGRWQSYDFHSTIGADSPVELLQLIQQTVSRVGEFVRTADTVVLTLGTAWAYRLRETGELVSNLHKLPASLFEKELLTADEIVNGLAEVHALLRRLNPNVRIVLTVSPVRHIKDTLPLNAVSKSVLRVACHYLSELLPGVSYFPAYELLVDELRDYRFYASDMLHPSEVAEDYIWDKFARAYFDADFGRFRKEWAAVRQSLGHRPLHLGAPEHRTFLDQTAERLERLASQGVDVRQEQRDVQRQLVSLPPPKPVRVVESAPEDDEERIDIGGDDAPVATLVAVSPAETTAQPPERRNDNRRDGRHNDRHHRNGQDRRNGRSNPPATPQPEEVIVPLEFVVDETVAIEAEALLSNPEASLLATPEEAYPAKKKKRRSRGGAKRTARKNAARLATDQSDTGSSADTEALAVEALAEEIAHEVAGVLPEETPLPEPLPGEAPLISPPPVAVSLEGAGPSVVEEATSVVAATVVRKRGTGPTPKKSKVITKSGIVARGPKRNALYRNPTPAEKAAAEAAATAAENTPATAPIISPPIMPEALLGRPAVLDTMVPSPAEPTPPSLPEPTNEAASPATSPPAKPRRGRPKAATPADAEASIATPQAAPAPAQAAEPAAVIEVVAPAEPETTLATPQAKAPKSTATKKPAATKKAAPKKAAPKKPVAKKTPAKRTPPVTDEPAA